MTPAGRLAGVAVGFLVAAVIGQQLVLPGTNASPVWPPAGVAVAAAWWWGRGVWPALLAGSLIANLIAPAMSGDLVVASVTNAVPAAIGGTIEALLGGWLLRRWTDPQAPLRRAQDVLTLAGAAPLISLPSATIGVASLGLHGLVRAELLPTAWWTWWLGDVTGIITIAPAILAWWVPRVGRLAVGEALAMLLALTATCGVLFFDLLPGEALQSSAYLVFPLLLWAAFRLGLRISAAGVALVSLMAVAATAAGRGPFVQADLNAALLSVQSFTAILAVAILSLAATMRERDRAEEELRGVNAGLDEAVRLRTEALQAEVREREQREREQRALGAVRDAIWTQSSSRDLERVLPAVRQSLSDAGVPFRTSGINVVDQASDPPRMTVALLDEKGRLVTEEVDAGNQVALRFWQDGQVAYRRDLDQEDPWGERPFIRPPTRCVLDVPFSHGTLAVASPTPGAFDAHLDYLQQLAGVLSEGFRRADDLRLLEERTEHLRREELRQRTILETAREGFWRIDNDALTVEVNEAMCQILGRAREEIVGRPLWDFVEGERKVHLRAEIDRRRQGESGAYETALKGVDGRTVPCRIHATPLLDEEGRPAGSFAMVSDLTDIHERERRQRLMSRFREAVWHLDSASGVLDLIDPMREIIDASGIDYTALGVNIIESQKESRVRAYTTGTHGFQDKLLEAVHGDRVIEFWRSGKVVNRGDLWQDDNLGELDTWTDHADRATRGPRSIVDIPFSHGTLAANSRTADAFVNSVEMLQDMAGILSEGFRRLEDLQALRDRTERAEAAQAAAEAANRSKSAFLANVSHEIRTPLNAILGFGEILQSRATDPATAQPLREIRDAATRLLGLVTDILDLTRTDAGELQLAPEPTDILALFADLERTYGEAARRKGLAFEIEVDPRLPAALVVDGKRLRQAVAALLDNAVKFTASGGVRLHVELDEAAPEVAPVIRVVDSGPGIPAQERQRIFEAFTQRDGQSINDYGGLGLGLALTLRLVKRMGGEVELDSDEGRGSTFTIRLSGLAPAVPSTAARPEFVAPPPDSGATGPEPATIPGRSVGERPAQLAAWLDTRAEEASQMAETLTINDVEAFAEQVRQRAGQHDSELVRSWAEDLRQQVALFDMEGMAASLRDVGGLARRVRQEAGL